MKSAVNAAGCKRHGGAGRGAHFRQRGGQEQQNHHQQGNQFPHGFLQGGAFGERGYLVATMKGYTICAMGASTHFLLARHFLVTGGGGFAARAKEKHRFYRTDANLAGKYTHSSNIIKMQNFGVDDFGKCSGCPSSNVKDEYP